MHPNPEFLKTWDDFPWSGAQREVPYRNLCRVSVNWVTIQFGRVREFRFLRPAVKRNRFLRSALFDEECLREESQVEEGASLGVASPADSMRGMRV